MPQSLSRAAPGGRVSKILVQIAVLGLIGFGAFSGRAGSASARAFMPRHASAAPPIRRGSVRDGALLVAPS